LNAVVRSLLLHRTLFIAAWTAGAHRAILRGGAAYLCGKISCGASAKHRRSVAMNGRRDVLSSRQRRAAVSFSLCPCYRAAWSQVCDGGELSHAQHKLMKNSVCAPQKTLPANPARQHLIVVWAICDCGIVSSCGACWMMISRVRTKKAKVGTLSRLAHLFTSACARRTRCAASWRYFACISTYIAQPCGFFMLYSIGVAAPEQLPHR